MASTPRPGGHRTLHFVVLTINILVAIGCLVGASALVFSQHVLSNTRKTAAIQPTSTNAPSATTAALAGTTPPGGPDSAPAASGESTPTTLDPTINEPFPPADPQAVNFLVTGSDNNPCPDANTAFPVPPRGQLGERSDTIMIIRIDPSTSRAAILSFPRDLWVKIHGTNGSNRINAAYTVNDPQKLIDTINDNFGISVQHYIQIDFCAFTTLVKAVGGVSVPFTYPARDGNTGLNITTAGCVSLNGDEALAYVRSRHYQYLNPKTNRWVGDGSSDYGRIARQQDFARRMLAKILSKGTFDVKVALGLIDVVQHDVVTDPNLTPAEELQLAGVLKTVKVDDLQTYRIVGQGVVIAGSAVILPQLGNPNMKAILAIFRGKAQLATAPAQPADTTPGVPDSAAAPTTTVPVTTTTVKRKGTPPTTTLPPTSATEVVNGIFPPKDVTCP